MHFSIPDLQQFNDVNGISYTGYSIYIDGFFHCIARYKQILSLHEQLRQQNPDLKLPQFPPKKLFLTNSQLEERRVLLEKYLQLVGQNPVLLNSDLLISFLFSAQQETHSVQVHEVDIEISLMNGYRIPLSVSSTDSSSALLDIACNYISVPKDFVKYFSLYLFNWSCAKDGQPAMKKLQEFESPYISQKYVRPDDKIVLRKSYWDPSYDKDLIEDRVTLDLLYLQTIEDLDLGWIIADAQSKEILSKFGNMKQKKEYLDFARKLRNYGRIPAGDAIMDSTNLGSVTNGWTRVKVSLAFKELTITSVHQPDKEYRYKITRMKCWRITTLHPSERPPVQLNGHGPLLEDPSKNYELSFEYLVSKDNLKWISFRSEHATFISVCLQSIVNELMRQKSGAGPSSPRPGRRGPFTYLRRDGSSQIIAPSSSMDPLPSTNGNALNTNTTMNSTRDTTRDSTMDSTRDSTRDTTTSTTMTTTMTATITASKKDPFCLKSLNIDFDTVAFKSVRECVENNAFEAIGDEEL